MEIKQLRALTIEIFKTVNNRYPIYIKDILTHIHIQTTS